MVICFVLSFSMAQFNCTSSNFYSYNNVTDVFTCKTLCMYPQFNGIDSSISTTVLRCESSCSQFISAIYTQGQKCYETCPLQYPYYDTDNNCISNCSNTSQKFFPNASSGACLANCGNNSFYYVNNTSLYCWDVCNGTYVHGFDHYDQTYSQRCASNCSNFSGNTKQYQQTCISKCPEEQPYYTNNICTNNCSNTANKFFPNDTSGECFNSCYNHYSYYYVNGTQMRCWFQCPQPLFWGLDAYDRNTDRCAESCYNFSQKRYIYQQSYQCVSSCPYQFPYYESNSVCVESCFTTGQIFSPNTSGACLMQCPINSFYFYQEGDYYNVEELQCWNVCQSTWYSGIDVFDSLIPRCAETCYNFYNAVFIYLQTCPATCPEEAVFYDQNRTCTSNCSLTQTHYFPNSTKGACLMACPEESFYYTVGDDIHCWPRCQQEEEYFYGIDPKYDYTMQRCATSCANFSGPMKSQGQQCIFVCPEESPFYDSTKQCYQSCSFSEEQKFTPNSSWGSCISSCQSGYYFIDNNYCRCWKTCPTPWFYGLDSYDPVVFRCITQCTYLQSIQPYYFANLSCTANCSEDNEQLFFPNSSSGACLKTCGMQGFYKVYDDSLRCWASCESEEYYGIDFAYDYTSQRCVSSCSSFDNSIQVFTPNDTSKQCLETCGITEENCYYGGVCNAFYYIHGNSYQCWKACDDSFGFDPTYDLRSMRCALSCTQFTNPTYARFPFCFDQCSVFPGYIYDINYDKCVQYSNMSTHYFIAINIAPNAPLQYYEAQNCTKTCGKFFPNSSKQNYCNFATSHYYYVENTADLHIWIQCSRAFFYGIDVFDSKTLRCADYCTDFVNYKPYYFINNSCTASCSDRTYKFFPNTTSGQCLKTCGNRNFYFVNGSDLHCWASCEEQMFYGFDIMSSTVMRCASSCSDFSNEMYQFGKMCLPSCPEEQPFFTNFVCTSDCSQTKNKFFPNSTSGSCLSTCEEESYYYIEGSQQHCWASCEESWFYGIDVYDPLILRCASSCLYMNSSQTFYTNSGECTANCSTTNQMFFPNATSGQCLTTCGSNDFYFINGADLHCWASCDQQMFYGIDSYSTIIQRCAVSCTDFEKAQPYYFSNNTCTDNCSKLFFPNASSGMCLISCSQNQYYFVDNKEMHCWTACDGKWLSGIDTYSSTIERCAESCKDFTFHVDKQHQACVPHQQYESMILKDVLIPVGVVVLVVIVVVLSIVWYRSKKHQKELREQERIADQNAVYVEQPEEVP